MTPRSLDCPGDVGGDGRLVLPATSVFPECRKQGIATELTRRVLDDVRAQRRRLPDRAHPSSARAQETALSSPVLTTEVSPMMSAARSGG